MPELFVLTEAERSVIQGVLDKTKRQVSQPRNRSNIEDSPPAPEVYVAKTPVGGIAGMVSHGTAGDSPGRATCDIYRLILGSSYDLLSQVEVSREVYNLSFSGIPGGTWVLVARDKFGHWYITGVSSISDTDSDTGTGTGTGSADFGLQVEGVDRSPIYTEVRTLRFDEADGFILSNPSPGVVRIDLALGTGTDVDDGIRTVRGADGSPSYTETQTLEFDEADGFRITQPSPGVVRIDLAPPTVTPGTGTGTDSDSFSYYQYKTSCEDGISKLYRQLVQVVNPLTNSVLGAWQFVGLAQCACPAVTIEETDLRCEQGENLNLYRRVISLQMNPSTGCLEKTAGAWTYIRTIGCCDPSCAADGTGTGTGTGLTPDEIEYWWCISRPGDLGTGTFGGDTGTGTGTNNSNCLFLSTLAKNALVALGWVAHKGPYNDIDSCEFACGIHTGTGTGTGTVGVVLAITACCPAGIPTNLVCTVTGGGSCSSTSFALVWNGTAWTGTYSGSTVTLSCAGTTVNDFVIGSPGCGFISFSVNPGATCSPAFLQFANVPLVGCCLGIANFVVTE